MSNRKSHMRFRLVPKSSTLDDLELLYLKLGFPHIAVIAVTGCWMVCFVLTAVRETAGRSVYDIFRQCRSSSRTLHRPRPPHRCQPARWTRSSAWRRPSAARQVRPPPPPCSGITRPSRWTLTGRRVTVGRAATSPSLVN